VRPGSGEAPGSGHPRRRGLLANYLSLSSATFVSQFLNLLAIVYLARVAGVGRFGEISLAQSIVLYFRLASDMGLDMLGSQRLAAGREPPSATVGPMMGARLANAGLALVVLLAAVTAIGPSLSLSRFVLAFGLSLLPIAALLEWAFTGLERMHIVGLSRLTSAGVWLLLVVLLVRGPDSAILAPLAYTAGLACAALVLGLIFRRGCGPLDVRFDAGYWWDCMRRALPLGLSFIVIQVYYSFGTVALGYFEGERIVGLYTAPQKIVLFLTSLAALFGTAIFPRLVALRRVGRQPFERLLRLAARATLSLAVPVAAGGTIVAPGLIRFLYGPGYEASVWPFQILVWSVLTVFANVPFAYALLAADSRKPYFYSVLAGAVVNVACNVLLIPRLHLVAPAVAMICSEVVVLTMLVAYSRRVARMDVAGTLLRCGTAAALMLAVLWPLRSTPLPLQLLGGAAAYVAGLAVFRGITAGDLTMLRAAMRSPGAGGPGA
jgi:O-antigen/teichoic acid export membrane protein